MVCVQLYENVERHDIGEMNCECATCGAKFWKKENLKNCCHHGQVILPKIEPTPNLKKLWNGTHKHSVYFFQHSRIFNCMFAITSQGVEQVTAPGRGPPVFKMRGKYHHRIGYLIPDEVKKAAWIQMYAIDPQMSGELRWKNFQNYGSLFIHHDKLNPVTYCRKIFPVFSSKPQISGDLSRKRTFLSLNYIPFFVFNYNSP